MEHIYSAYTKVINDVTFYFLKKYITFPEFQDMPEVLDSMGMHRDFYRACDIAKIYDEGIVNKLFDELHIMPVSGKIIPGYNKKSIPHSLGKNIQQVILKLRLAGI
ncbi:MAG: hypothetical protein Q8891_03705 [Bacteroidota bacterium]|nr:hypothetical protein [Bacteroidota bacterium]